MDGDYRALIVSYGTMSRVCRTAIDVLKEQGLEVAMIRPQTLFPFPEAAIRDAARKQGCQVAISIEMSMGQMVEDVERSIRGLCPVEWYGKCGGEVPTPEEVMDVVREMVKR
jgi:2-oxoglutarate ferredoxin oxidoreductase subunit alpha